MLRWVAANCFGRQTNDAAAGALNQRLRRIEVQVLMLLLLWSLTVLPNRVVTIAYFLVDCLQGQTGNLLPRVRCVRRAQLILAQLGNHFPLTLNQIFIFGGVYGLGVGTAMVVAIEVRPHAFSCLMIAIMITLRLGFERRHFGLPGLLCLGRSRS